MASVDEKLKEQLVTDYKTADISDEDKLILDYVELLNRDATLVTPEYIDMLKRRGLTDRMLHDIVQVTAYFNYVNRLADGLGVELEEN